MLTLYLGKATQKCLDSVIKFALDPVIMLCYSKLMD